MGGGDVIEVHGLVELDDEELLSSAAPGQLDDDGDEDANHGELRRAAAEIVKRSTTDPGAAMEQRSRELLLRQRQEDGAGFERTWRGLKSNNINCRRLEAALDRLEKEQLASQEKSRQAAKRSHRDEGMFRLTDRGVEKRCDGDDGPEWRWFCSPLQVAAETRNTDGKAWGRLLKITTREGQVHEWAMPMELLAGDGNVYRAELLHQGLEIAPGKWARDALYEYISTWPPSERARCVERTGWYGDAFVLPDATYGNAGGEGVIFQTLTGGHAFRVAGDLETWRRDVGQLAVGNSRLVFAISAAFAAPLLGLLDCEGGGFNLRGASSSGKTTALHVAASICGGGERPAYPRTWRATANGLEGVAAAHNDMLLCLDEMGQVASHEAGEVAYMLANGVGKMRARRDGTGRPPAEWRTLFLSTGELGLADKIREDGRKRVAAGQQVRVVDIPADAGAGHGLFENLHGFPSADAFAKHLKAAGGRVYGTPIRAFLEVLTANADQVREAAASFRREFEAEHLPAGADGQVSRVLGRFGVVAFAGELAIEAGILPWAAGEAVRGAATCFAAWLRERGGAGALEVQNGIAQVRAFLEQHGESRFSPWGSGEESDRVTINRAGFRRANDAGGLDYFVLPEVWRSEICKGLDAGLVARALLERGYLVPEKSGTPQSRHRLPGMGGQVRCYHVRSSIMEGSDA